VRLAVLRDPQDSTRLGSGNGQAFGRAGQEASSCAHSSHMKARSVASGCGGSSSACSMRAFLSRDTRRDLAAGAYRWFDFAPVVEDGGDVRARLRVRVREARQALFVIEQVLPRAASTNILVEGMTLAPFAPSFGVVEAWRGRLVHMVMADDHDRLHRVKIVDPSFFNWPALARALEDNIVPDFPLCNKSFNQSYSGNDL
jgi:Ni,Fe-hydrogenase III large subunit